MKINGLEDVEVWTLRDLGLRDPDRNLQNQCMDFRWWAQQSEKLYWWVEGGLGTVNGRGGLVYLGLLASGS